MNVSSLLNPIKREKNSPSIGGFTRFSTVDWPGKLASTVFISGCPWRCHYCHNPHLQTRHQGENWSQILSFLKSRVNLLDGVVLSGGEPLTDPFFEQITRDILKHEFGLALHTAGMYPGRLKKILPELQWAALDIKTTERHYEKLTGQAKSFEQTAQSLEILLDWGGNFECRTTWSPDWLPESELLDLAQSLSRQGVREYAIQRFRSPGTHTSNVSLSPLALNQLKDMFETFSYR